MKQVNLERVIEKLMNRISTLEVDRAVLMVQVEQLEQEIALNKPKQKESSKETVAKNDFK